MLLYSVYALAGVLSLLGLFPSLRPWVLTQLGWTNLSLSGIVGDLETKIVQLETHAKDLLDQAIQHRDTAKELADKAEAKEMDASRAKTIASNVKTLIAA